MIPSYGVTAAALLAAFDFDACTGVRVLVRGQESVVPRASIFPTGSWNVPALDFATVLIFAQGEGAAPAGGGAGNPFSMMWPLMLIFVLARFGIVTARFLIRNFKYAVLIMFVAAAIVTPDGSVVNQVVMAAPMIVLYIISIGVAWLFGKKRALEDEP